MSVSVRWVFELEQRGWREYQQAVLVAHHLTFCPLPWFCSCSYAASEIKNGRLAMLVSRARAHVWSMVLPSATEHRILPWCVSRCLRLSVALPRRLCSPATASPT